jgi:hypothetical protein
MSVESHADFARHFIDRMQFLSLRLLDMIRLGELPLLDPVLRAFCAHPSLARLGLAGVTLSAPKDLMSSKLNAKDDSEERPLGWEHFDEGWAW